MERIYVWDNNKAESNIKKHGVTFYDAAKVFNDPFASYEQDRIVEGEMRWQVIGMTGNLAILLVAYTYQEDISEKDILDNKEVVRIISARKATKTERRQYERNKNQRKRPSAVHRRR